MKKPNLHKVTGLLLISWPFVLVFCFTYVYNSQAFYALLQFLPTLAAVILSIGVGIQYLSKE